MTPQQFRKVALSQADTIESQHMGHPDFRTGGKIFASLGKPNDDWAMIKLTHEQQKVYCSNEAFQPCSGAWGRQGYTNVKLDAVTTAIVRSAILLAIENVSSKQSQKITVAKPLATEGQGKAPQPKGTADSESVSTLLRELDHPMKEVIESVRTAILKSDSRITEGIKWNAPSFYCDGWFATFHLRAKEGVLLVLHHGAKVRESSSADGTIDDPSKLLTWASADRATITFSSTSDFKKKHAALRRIIKQWLL